MTTLKYLKLCKRFRIKTTYKKNGKRVRKSKRVVMKQLRKRMKKYKISKRRSSFGKKRRSRFGNCGCNKTLRFGKKRSTKTRTKSKSNVKMIKKLHKLCRLYGVKIGKKSPSVLSKQCIKRAKMILKKSRKSRFGFPSIQGLVTGQSSKDMASAQQSRIEEKNAAEIKKAKIGIQLGHEEIELKKFQIMQEMKAKEHERAIEEAKAKQAQAETIKVKAQAEGKCLEREKIAKELEAEKKQKEADAAAKAAQELAARQEKTQKVIDQAEENHDAAKEETKELIKTKTDFGKSRFGKKRR